MYSEHSCLRRFKSCWDETLTSIVTSYALRSQHPRTLLRICNLLCDVTPKKALQFWRRLVAGSCVRRFNRRERMVAFLGLFAFLREGWDGTWDRLLRTSRATRIRFFAEH